MESIIFEKIPNQDLLFQIELNYQFDSDPTKSAIEIIINEDLSLYDQIMDLLWTEGPRDFAANAEEMLDYFWVGLR